MLTYPAWLPRYTVLSLAETILSVYKTDWGQLAEFPEKTCMFGACALGTQTNFGCVIPLDDAIIVAMRGTNTIQEWITDGEILESTLFKDWGHVHHGFYRIFESCLPEINESLVKHPEKPVIITGHSLGGAIATLLASELHVTNPQANISVVTFASPKVGDAAFVAEFDSSKIKSCRILNAFDHVPRLPPSIPLHYEHVDEPVVFYENFGDVVRNHQLVNYRKAL